MERAVQSTEAGSISEIKNIMTVYDRKIDNSFILKPKFISCTMK
jgi:hypothetical protein